MASPMVRLYVNDPLGKRWLANVEAAGRAERELGAVIEIVNNGSPEYEREDDPPPCPSVMVNGELIAEGAIPYAVLEAELLAAGASPRGSP